MRVITGRDSSMAGSPTRRGLRYLPPREPRKRPSDAPRQPRIHIGMWVLIKVPCEFRNCAPWRHGYDSSYVGVIEQKRGDKYLVVTRLYGSFWAGREHMYTRDHNGITWTTPLLVKEENEGMVAPGMAMVQPCRGPHRQ